MSSVSTDGLLLVGGIPRPIGGVTQHVWRLSLLMGESRCTVCDMHPRPFKYAIEGILRIAPDYKWLRLPWLVRELRRSPAAVSHLHFSACSTLGLIRPFLTLERRDRFRMLTLHHGNQHGLYAKMGSWMQGLVKRGLHYFDRIVHLSKDQYDFYRNIIGIPESKLFAGSSYIPFLSGGLGMSGHGNAVAGHDGASAIPSKRPGTIRLVASGYPSRIYHHDQTIKFVDSLRQDFDAELYLSIYGQIQDPGYHNELMAMVAERPHVHLMRETDFLDFAALLKSADLYLRPNSVDSYGIAVADAITLGTPALASDVCDRHPDAFVFPTADFECFEAIGRQILSDPHTNGIRLRGPEQIKAEIQASLAMYADVIKLPEVN